MAVSLPAARPVNTQDRVLGRIQDNLWQCVKALLLVPIVDGELAEGISLVAGVDKPVGHGLGRRARFYAISPTASGVVFASPTANPFPTKQVIVRSTATMQCDLWLF